MKKHSKIFSYKTGWLCVAVSTVCSVIHDITGIALFTALALACGLIAIPCFFREIIESFGDKKVSKEESD